MGSLVIEPVDVLSEDQLAEVRGLYEDAFAAQLRVPFPELTQPGPVDQMFAALDPPAVAGFASLRLLGPAGWSFLRYFAIAGARQSQGVGRQFWQLLQQAVAAAGWPSRIVFEVENPDEAAGDDAERLVRQRRIGFWTACGARLLPVPGYVLPDYTDSGVIEPVLLMDGSPAATPVCQGDELRALVLAIYTGRYGLSPDDPAVTRALGSI